ncbi:Lrp/AsnC family transcriptional regulator [Yeguia hominis]|uniref:Lrp/AsnC family transcriptional regulator n=1 Tax=Yeguia hominis TaxID=2763662 RepID=A0A926HQT3_9FIRM|nr:Lrp/AsnC family transcriptional regulator [Yeguia hominis]MBC8532548.1 Lrp/AsnC family transcriptional regulator [Yeguia hominis]
MYRLLKLLSENDRLTTDELAAMLAVSPEEVAREIAEYEKAGVIKGYNALINWEKADCNRATALIELKVSPKKETGFDEIAHRIMEFEEVESVYLMSGGYDLAVTVNAKSMQDIAMFVVRRLSPLDGVLSTATHFVLTRYKDGGVIFDDGEKNDERRSNLW